jgi:hypothetical protein
LCRGSLGLLNCELPSASLFSSGQLTYFHTVAGILTQGLRSHLQKHWLYVYMKGSFFSDEQYSITNLGWLQHCLWKFKSLAYYTLLMGKFLLMFCIYIQGQAALEETSWRVSPQRWSHCTALKY